MSEGAVGEDATWRPRLVTRAVPAGVALTARAMRMAVVLLPDRVLVRGVLWDRSIARSSVLSIDDHLAFPLIRWTAATGRRRTTPVQIMTTESGALEVFRQRARDGIAQLQAWAAEESDRRDASSRVSPGAWRPRVLSAACGRRMRG